MSQLNHSSENTPGPDEQNKQLVEDIAALVELSRDFDVAWEIANRVCDRYGLGLAAA
jgi:hypothetical protein